MNLCVFFLLAFIASWTNNIPTKQREKILNLVHTHIRQHLLDWVYRQCRYLYLYVSILVPFKFAYIYSFAHIFTASKFPHGINKKSNNIFRNNNTRKKQNKQTFVRIHEKTDENWMRFVE